MGIFDLPAIIDFIIHQTGRQKISYIGHSQGTAQLFAALTLLPEYFEARLNSFLAFGPVTKLHNCGSTFLKIVASTHLDELLTRLDIFHEFLPSLPALQAFENFTCKNLGFFCTGLLKLLADANIEDDDMDRFKVFIGHFPSGASLRTLNHFADNIRNNRFTQLDANRTPYDLSKIKNIPIGLFVGGHDLLATVTDNRLFKEVLTGNGSLDFYKEYEHMGHSTFFLGKTMEHVNDAIAMLEKNNN